MLSAWVSTRSSQHLRCSSTRKARWSSQTPRSLPAGTIEVIPPVAPLTLFSWDPNRVLPVRLTDFTITEEAHDVYLNPIRAKVSLSLRVLSYSDLSVTHPGYHIFMEHQIVKETLASLGHVNDLSAIGGVSQILE